MRQILSWLIVAANVTGSMLLSTSAGAQATSDCYYDANKPNAFPNGRMVDAQPLMGQLQSTPQTTAGLHYLQYLPKGHDPTKKWPVIVFMHGSGEKNNNPSDQSLVALTKHSLPRIVENPDWNWPLIVISPQIGDGGWLAHADQISQTLDYVAQNYGGDPNRFYLTGLSYGGVGTFAVGIALAEKIAAIMPVTPGGESIDNWAERSKIVDMPIWMFNGKIDNQYGNNSNRIMELEQSGASTFFRYDYAFLDEYNDVVPAQALTEKHIFGSYENIPHDVWHATYGIYCPNTPTLITEKTVQYEWLLEQSLDGSSFVDPRDPTPPASDAGAEPDSGSAGSGGEVSGGGTSGSGGVAEPAGGAAGSGGTAGSPDSNANAGNGGNAGSTPSGDGGKDADDSKKDDSGCQLVATNSGPGGFALLLGLAAIAAMRKRKRKRA